MDGGAYGGFTGRLVACCIIHCYKVICDPLTSCELYDKLVTPILAYGCEIWGYLS